MLSSHVDYVMNSYVINIDDTVVVSSHVEPIGIKYEMILGM